MSIQEVSLLIEQLTQKQQGQNLIPYLEYGKALNLVNTGNLQEGHDAIDRFIKKYKQQGVRSINGRYLSLDSSFWNDLEKQVEDIKELQRILSQPKSDKQLYEEGAFWFNKKRFTYNFLERTFGSSSLPVKWEGNSTYTQYSVTENLIDTFWQKHKSRNQLLKSIEVFQILLKEYPNSDLKEKAEYSVALSYYYLYREGWVLKDFQDSKNIAIQAFEKFVSDFPKSSMADDALISIAFLEFDRNRNKSNAIRVLERQIQEYPNGDRIKEARKMLEDVKKEVAQQQQSGNNLPRQGIGIQMDSKPLNRGVLIVGVVLNSPANKAGILQGDLLLEVNNTVVSDSNQVINIIRNSQLGQTLSLRIERQGKQQIINVTIGRLN